MSVVYTVLAAVVLMSIIVAIDMTITETIDKNSVFQKDYIKMPLSYFIGILIFLIIVRMIFS